MPPTEEMTRTANFIEFSSRLGIADNTTVVNSTDDAISLVTHVIFPDGNGGIMPNVHKGWTENQVKRVRFQLMEFVVNYRSPIVGVVVQNSMQSYICGLQRLVFKNGAMVWNLQLVPYLTVHMKGSWQ